MKTSVNVKIDSQDYEVNYPTVGEKLQIENVKLLLTNNNYGDLARSGHTTALDLLDLVDSVSYFSILIPEIKKSIKMEDFLTMDPIKAKLMIKAFKKYRDFLSEVDTELNSEDDESTEETKEV